MLILELLKNANYELISLRIDHIVDDWVGQVLNRDMFQFEVSGVQKYHNELRCERSKEETFVLIIEKNDPQGIRDVDNMHVTYWNICRSTNFNGFWRVGNLNWKILQHSLTLLTFCVSFSQH